MCLPKQAYHLICIIKEAKRKQAETVVDLATIIFYHRNVTIDWKKNIPFISSRRFPRDWRILSSRAKNKNE